MTQALLRNLLPALARRTGLVYPRDRRYLRILCVPCLKSGGINPLASLNAVHRRIERISGMSMAKNTKDKGFMITLLHSGYVKAGMDTSGENEKYKEQVEPTAVDEKLRAVLLKKGIVDTGRFRHTGTGFVLIKI